MPPKSSKNHNETKAFQLFEFLNEDEDESHLGRRLKEIDFAPKSSVSYDETACQLVTKYLPPPYNDVCWDIFNGIVKSQLPAPKDCSW